LPDIDITTILIRFLVLLFSLSVHEAAHAWTASRLGDDTARRLGRVTLNPIVHIDPIGTLLLPLVALASGSGFLIGWAKPTPVNVRHLRDPRRDNILVTVAGPTSNLAIAVAAAVLLRTLGSSSLPGTIAFEMLTLNVLLAVFNMLPIPPLDGGHVLLGVLTPRAAVRLGALQQYGFFILMALMLTGTLWAIIGPPYYLIVSWLL
jgi:Zn-dependent protease